MTSRLYPLPFLGWILCQEWDLPRLITLSNWETWSAAASQECRYFILVFLSLCLTNGRSEVTLTMQRDTEELGVGNTSIVLLSSNILKLWMRSFFLSTPGKEVAGHQCAELQWQTGARVWRAGSPSLPRCSKIDRSNAAYMAGRSIFSFSAWNHWF